MQVFELGAVASEWIQCEVHCRQSDRVCSQAGLGLAGVLLVPASPRDVFVLSKVRDSLAIFTATTSVSHSWDLEQAWTFTSTTDSLKLNTTELFLTATNSSGAGRLVLSRDLSQVDRSVLDQGQVFISARINPLDWQSGRGLVR